VLDFCGLLFAQPKKCFLDHLPCAFDVAENPGGVSDKLALVLVQGCYDPAGFRRFFHPGLTSSNVRKVRLLDMGDDPFVHWIQALEGRHLASLSFSEVRRAVQALSSLYVERRDRIDAASAFTGAGKRAAFAMYFGPLHFLLVREIVRGLKAEIPRDTSI